ncbi:MAG: YggS family pyridoxal phosphate-dependent enzyme [Paludibacteraceae bacterium]|nr:YggS family pyridoxal phosphate-dependent enzyme [Paludibacteraceae bacterium]
MLHHIAQRLASIRATIPDSVTLVCVSKFHSHEAIMEAYACGERDFGESRVQELLPKYEALPKDIRWHFIGHLQTNKVKQILPFVHLIHSVDSLRLLETINREAEKIQRRVKVLLEVHVAKEETKSGFTPEEINQFITHNSKFIIDYPWVEICGVMGMATNTEDQSEWRRCFREIKHLGEQLLNNSKLLNNSAPQISMGMSDDYLVAIEEGSNMVRIGSTIFGLRQY